MFEVIFTESYTKRAVKFFRKHPNLKERYTKVITVLKTNPFHPSLRIHKLSGKKREFYSVSLDMSYRIIMNFIIEDGKIILLDIGYHSGVYG